MSEAGGAVVRPVKIISGGQTGADLGALKAAHRLGIPTGGWAPQGWLNESGPQPELLRDCYGLEEASGGYEVRTEWNARDADGTAIFAHNLRSDGTRLTILSLERWAKPWVLNPTAAELREFVAGHQIRVLNIAGNRESLAPGIQADVETLVIEAFAPGPGAKSSVPDSEGGGGSFPPSGTSPRV